MSTMQFARYRSDSLKELTDKLCKEYYTVLEAMCKGVAVIINNIEQEASNADTALYISMCKKLLDQVMDLVNLRVGVLLPYVQELQTKQTENHNCAACTGSCGFNHSSQLVGIKESHQKLKELLYRLQMVALPLYTDKLYPDEYKVLRNEVTLIDTTLTELFYIEESALVPMIMKAQNDINAFS